MAAISRLRLTARRVRRGILARRRPLAALLTTAAVLVGLRATADPPPPTVAVVVAQRDLPAVGVLAPDDVALAERAPDGVPEGRLRTTRSAIGQALAAPVRAGEALTDVRLVGQELADSHPGRVVLPIRLPDPGVVALLRPGDRLDLAAVDPESGEVAQVADDVLVVSIPPREVVDSTLTGRLILASVAPADTPKLASAAVLGFLQVAYSR